VIGIVVESALLGVALTAASPIAVMGVLVMMPAVPRGRRSATAFVAGWFCVLLAIGLAGILGAGGLHFGQGSTASKAGYWLEIGLGALGLGYAVVRYRRARAGLTPPPPKWLDRAGRIPPPAAFGMGALLPYYVVAVACVNEILESNVSTGGQLVAYLVFLVVTTGLLAAPLLVTRFSRSDPEAATKAMRAWLDRNSQTFITLMVAAIGALMVGRGLIGLLNA